MLQSHDEMPKDAGEDDHYGDGLFDQGEITPPRLMSNQQSLNKIEVVPNYMKLSSDQISLNNNQISPSLIYSDYVQNKNDKNQKYNKKNLLSNTQTNFQLKNISLNSKTMNQQRKQSQSREFSNLAHNFQELNREQDYNYEIPSQTYLIVGDDQNKMENLLNQYVQPPKNQQHRSPLMSNQNSQKKKENYNDILASGKQYNDVNKNGNQQRQFMFQRKKESVSSTNKKNTNIIIAGSQNIKTKQDFYKNINLLSQNQINNIFNMKQNYSRTSSLNRKNISQNTTQQIISQANLSQTQTNLGQKTTQNQNSKFIGDRSTDQRVKQNQNPNLQLSEINSETFILTDNQQNPHGTHMKSNQDLQQQEQNQNDQRQDSSIMRMNDVSVVNNNNNANNSQIQSQHCKKITKSDIYKIYVQGEVRNLYCAMPGSQGFETYRVSGGQLMKNKMKQQVLKKHLTQVINVHNQKQSFRKSQLDKTHNPDQTQLIVIQETSFDQQNNSPKSSLLRRRELIQKTDKLSQSQTSRNIIQNNQKQVNQGINQTMILLSDPVIDTLQNAQQEDNTIENYQTQPDLIEDQTPQIQNQNNNYHNFDSVTVQLQSIYLNDKKQQFVKSSNKLASKSQKKNRSEHISIHQDVNAKNNNGSQSISRSIKKGMRLPYFENQQEVLLQEKPSNLQKTYGIQQIRGLIEQSKGTQNLIDINLQDLQSMSDVDLLNLKQNNKTTHNRTSPFSTNSFNQKINQKLSIKQEKLLKEYQQFFKKIGINLTNEPTQDVKNMLFNQRKLISESNYYQTANMDPMHKTHQTNSYAQQMKPPQVPKKIQNAAFLNSTAKASQSPFKMVQPELMLGFQQSSQTPIINSLKLEQANPSQLALQPKIKILNKPFTHLKNHPINIAFRQINSFLNATLVKVQNPVNQKNVTFDQSLINSLSKQLSIELPKNQFLNLQLIKSKNFNIHCKEMILKKLFNVINDSNQIELNFQRSQFQFYKGFVGKGNNAQLILQLFKNNRWWWNLYQNLQYTSEGDIILPNNCKDISSCNVNLYKEDFKEHNFIWTQWKKHRHFNYLKPVVSQSKTCLAITQKQSSINLDQNNIKQGNLSNEIKMYAKLENNFHLSNKCALFYNMKQYYEAIGQNPFDIIPLTYHVKKGTDDPEFFKFLQYYKEIEQQIEQRKALMKSARSSRLKKEKKDNSDQKLDIEKSHFKRRLKRQRMSSNDSMPNLISPRENTDSNNICNTPKQNKAKEIKQNQNTNVLSQRYSSIERQQESFTKLPAITNQSSQLASHISHKNSTQKLKTKSKKEKQNKPKNIWIIKPGENTNRGHGITVCQKLSEIKAILLAQSYDYQRTFIIQKYMEYPALYKNRKFDIRCYGMLTSINGHLKGFFYEEGYIRTSSREYSLKKIGNKLIHLTNDAVQKKADDYGKYEVGNKVSFKEYQSYLNETCPELQIDFMRDIFLSQIKRIITDTFRATYKSIDPKSRHHTFEIYGYDFMLDFDYKVNLIEVNTNPCIETTCPILQRVITDMVDSGLRIALDPLFPPPNFNKRVNLQQIPLTQWELVFDTDIDSIELDKIFQDHEMNLRKSENSLNPVKDLEKALIIEEDQEDDFD